MPAKRKSLVPAPAEPSPKRVTRSDSKSSLTLLDKEEPRRGLHRAQDEHQEDGEEEMLDMVVVDARRSSALSVKVGPPRGKRRGRPPHAKPLPVDEPEPDGPPSEADSPLPDPFTPAKRGQTDKGKVIVRYGRKSSGSGRRGRVESSSDEEEEEELPESPTKGRSRSERSLKAAAAATPALTPTKVPLPSTGRSNKRRRSPSPIAAASPTKKNMSADELPIQQSPPEAGLSRAASRAAGGQSPTDLTNRRSGRRLPEVEVVIDIRSPRKLKNSPVKASPLRKEVSRVEERAPESVTPSKTRRRQPVEDDDEREEEEEGAELDILPQSSSADDVHLTSPSKPPPALSLPMPLPAHLHDHLRLQQQAILSRLHRSVAKPGELADPDGALAALGSLLSGTVERGEGNSCLVLGPQGSGKTRAVQLALTALPTQPIVVRLSGLTHPDDRSALRELQRQVLHSLGQRTPSPSATGAAQEEEDETAPFASLPPLPRPLVVVLSEFDVFCMRPRQALLYVLLDAVQSLRGGGVGIAVIGMTARIDCVNLLEKRVKSRFSHRIIRVTPAQSVEEYVALAREFFLPVDAALQDGRHEWTQLWSRSVEGLLADKQAVAMLRHTWELVHDLRLLQRVLTDAIARLTPDAPWLTIALLTRAITSQRGPTSFPHLPDLSAASLGLLIAVYQAGSAGHDVFTFQQLEHTYRAFARDHSSALGQGNGPAVPREGLIAAFDEFVRMKVFTPAALPFAPAMREFSKYRCAVDRREIEDAVRKGGSTGIRKWLKHWSGH